MTEAGYRDPAQSGIPLPRDESSGDRDYPVEVIEGLVESLDHIERLLVEYEENVGDAPRLELAYVVDRFDNVVRTLHAARTREVR